MHYAEWIVEFRMVLSSEGSARVPFAALQHREGTRTVVPVVPLELEFISGPRMGEKVVVCQRICTLGRAEGNAIQAYVREIQ